MVLRGGSGTLGTRMAYKPLTILGPKTGLSTEKEEFLLPNDAYVTIENAYTRLQKLNRKDAAGLLGRLRRVFTSQPMGNTTNVTTQTINIYSALVPPITEAHPEIQPGSVTISVDAGTATFSDASTSNGSLIATGTGVTAGSSINYSTGNVTLVFSGAPGVVAITISFAYYPGLPVMGLCSRELETENNEQCVAFDTKYAYRFVTSEWQELPSTTPTTWSGTDIDFFWSTNYYQDANNNRFFWVTNFSGALGDPIRYYDGTTWTQFVNTGTGVGKADLAPTYLWQSRIILPFRGRLIMMNTWEGATLATSKNRYNRIRWSQIGNPIGVDSWRDDIPGKGGFLELPTSENIISAGFVRDNLVVFCERSTWQLRYTGQAIAPFQFEKINSELGSKSPFGSILFDGGIVSVGSRGIISCNSYEAKRIDDKIQNFVFDYTNNDFQGPLRIQALRDYQLRLAYFTYSSASTDTKYPDRRLLYNYEEDSFAIFKDSYTALGELYNNNDTLWSQVNKTWETIEWSWAYTQSAFPLVVGGNQQGFVMQLTRPHTPNQSLSISAIDGSVSPMVLTIYNHNMQTGDTIRFSGIPSGTAFASTLNNKVFAISRYSGDPQNKITLLSYNSSTRTFFNAVPGEAGTYVGYGRAAPAENFIIRSKKFNFLDLGQKIQLGFIDILTEKTTNGEFSINVYTNYADGTVVNNGDDEAFNTVISTSDTTGQQAGQSKIWNRVQCAIRASFIQTEFTFSPQQMSEGKDLTDVEIDAQILWVRPAGSQLN
jgi:hypothetical protein